MFVVATILHGGVVIADSSLVTCIVENGDDAHPAGPCDMKRPSAIESKSSVSVRFLYHDLQVPPIPGAAKSSALSLSVPDRAAGFVAETTDAWPTRRMIQGWDSYYVEPVGDTVRDVVVRIKPASVLVKIPVTLARTDLRAASYLHGDLTLQQFIDDILPLQIDSMMVSEMEPSWEAFSLDPTSIRGVIAARAQNMHPDGAHTFFAQGEQRHVKLNVRVELEDATFARTAPFSTTPTMMFGNSAEWDGLSRETTIAIQLEQTHSASLRERAAQVQRSTEQGWGENVLAFSTSAWPVGAIMVSIATFATCSSKASVARHLCASHRVYRAALLRGSATSSSPSRAARLAYRRV
jgi:hypothetical protein